MFGAFIGAEDETDPEPEAEAELVEEDPEAELVEEDPEAELVEEDPEAGGRAGSRRIPVRRRLRRSWSRRILRLGELVEEDPEAELVEADPEAESTDDDGTVRADRGGVAAAGAAVGGLAATDRPMPRRWSRPPRGVPAGSGGGSKKGVWIGVAAAAAAVVLIIGVVALGSGGKSAAKKDDQVAAGIPEVDHDHRGAVDHRLVDRHDPGADHRHRDAHHRHLGARLLHELDGRSDHVDRSRSWSGPRRRLRRPRRGPTCRCSCPPNLKPDSTTAITLHNVGGTSTSFLVTWSALKTGVTVSPTTGTVGASATPRSWSTWPRARPGSGSRVTIKWSGGATSCNLLVQSAVPDRPTTRRQH